MKLSVTIIAVLAASASAFPKRIISFSSLPEYLPADSIAATNDHDAVRAPFHGSHSAPGPIGSLLYRLGLASPPHTHRPEIDDVDAWRLLAAQKVEDKHAVVEGWKHKLEEMVRPIEADLPPVTEGTFSILPIFDEMGRFDHEVARKQNPGNWDSLEGKDGVRVHHRHGHNRPHPHHHETQLAKTFNERVERALNNLTNVEATIVVFVFGAILGCIPRFLIMMFIITRRSYGGGDRRSCAERRAARREARRARKEERKAKKAGVARFDGEEGEVLPAYTEDGDEIAEKV